MSAVVSNFTAALRDSVLRTNSPPAIVLGLDGITGLQTARVLSRRGVPVIGVGFGQRHPFLRTRVCSGVFSVEIDDLVDALVELGERMPGCGVLFPCTDLSVLAVSRSRDRLAAQYKFALPAEETVEQLVSKVSLARLAERMGWKAPKTMLLHSISDAEQAAGTLDFPVVLKPPVKNASWTDFTSQKCIRVNTPAEFLTTYRAASHTADTLVVQEWVPGREYWTANCYYDRNHEPLVTYVSQKLRQWPIETGTGCSGVARKNPDVAAFIEDMFREAAFHGQAYIEVKRDPRDGSYVLLEPNIGRSTGRSVMAEADGLELLMAQYNDLIGQPTRPYRDQPEVGVKWVYWRRELRVLYEHWRRGELTIGDWWRSISGRRITAVFDWRDPLPFVLHWFDGFRKLVRSKSRSRAESKPEPIPAPRSPRVTATK